MMVTTATAATSTDLTSEDSDRQPKAAAATIQLEPHTHAHTRRVLALALIDLPDDVLIAILSYLPPAALTALERSSHAWLATLRSPAFDPVWHATLTHAFPIITSPVSLLPRQTSYRPRVFLQHALASALLLQWDLSSLELAPHDLAHPILTLPCPRNLRSLVSTDQRLLLVHGSHLDPITAPAASIPYHLYDPLRAPRGFAQSVSHVVAHAAPGLIVYQLRGAHCVHIHWCTAGAADGGKPAPFVCWPRGALVGVNGKGGCESVAYLPRRHAVVLGPRPSEVIVYDMGYVPGPPEVARDQVLAVTKIEGGWVVLFTQTALWVLRVGGLPGGEGQAPGQEQSPSNKWRRIELGEMLPAKHRVVSSSVVAYGDLVVYSSRDPTTPSPLVHVHVWSPVHCPEPRLLVTNVLYAWPFADPSPALRHTLVLDLVIMDGAGHVHVKCVDGKQLLSGVGLPVQMNCSVSIPGSEAQQNLHAEVVAAAAWDEGYVDDTAGHSAAGPGMGMGVGTGLGLTVGGKAGHVVLHVERSACGSVAAIVVPPVEVHEQQSPVVGGNVTTTRRTRRSSDLLSPPPYAAGGFHHHWQ